MLIIKPEPGEFRTEIKDFDDKIKAYTLLERNKKQSTEDNTKAKLNNKSIFIEPPEKTTQPAIRTLPNMLHAIKNNPDPLFWSYGKIATQDNTNPKNTKQR